MNIIGITRKYAPGFNWERFLFIIMLSICFISTVFQHQSLASERIVYLSTQENSNYHSVDWKTWSKWIWTTPYEMEVIAVPKLRIWMNIPLHYQIVMNRDLESEVGANLQTSHNQQHQLVSIDLEFNKKTYVLNLKSKNKLIPLRIQVQYSSDDLNGVIHQSCHDLGVSSELKSINRSLKENLIVITCSQNKRMIQANILHPKGHRIDSFMTTTSSVTNDSWSKVEIDVNSNVIPEDYKMAELQLREKGKTEFQSYSLLANKKTYPRIIFFGSLYSEYLSYAEPARSLDMYQFSFIGSLDFKYHLVRNVIYLKSKIYTTLFPVFHGPSNVSKVRFYGIQAHMGFDFIENKLEGLQFVPYIGIRTDGMNVDSNNWGYDVLVGPELQFELKYFSDYNTVSLLSSLLLFKNNTTSFRFSNREIGISLRYELDTHDTITRHTNLFITYQNSRFAIPSGGSAFQKNQISLGIIKSL